MLYQSCSSLAVPNLFQVGCTKPVPLGLGEVKRDLFFCHGSSHIPTTEAIPWPMGQALYTTMELVPVPLLPTWPKKWVYQAVKHSFYQVVIRPPLWIMWEYLRAGTELNWTEQITWSLMLSKIVSKIRGTFCWLEFSDFWYLVAPDEKSEWVHIF